MKVPQILHLADSFPIFKDLITVFVLPSFILYPELWFINRLYEERLASEGFTLETLIDFTFIS